MLLNAFREERRDASRAEKNQRIKEERIKVSPASRAQAGTSKERTHDTRHEGAGQRIGMKKQPSLNKSPNPLSTDSRCNYVNKQ